MRFRLDPGLVREAREHALLVMAKAGIEDEGHIEDVRLVVSEIVTNAMRAAERYAATLGRAWPPYETPISLRVECHPAWTHLLVTDPDPRMPEPAPRDFLDETGGRGLTIVASVADHSWVDHGRYGKTFHAVISHPGTELSAREAAMLKAHDETRDMRQSVGPSPGIDPLSHNDLLTPREVAQIFGVRTTTIARWAREGRLTPMLTPGGHRRYTRATVRNLLTDQAESGEADEAAEILRKHTALRAQNTRRADVVR